MRVLGDFRWRSKRHDVCPVDRAEVPKRRKAMRQTERRKLAINNKWEKEWNRSVCAGRRRRRRRRRSHSTDNKISFEPFCWHDTIFSRQRRPSRASLGRAAGAHVRLHSAFIGVASNYEQAVHPSDLLRRKSECKFHFGHLRRGACEGAESAGPKPSCPSGRRTPHGRELITGRARRMCA